MAERRDLVRIIGLLESRTDELRAQIRSKLGEALCCCISAVTLVAVDNGVDDGLFLRLAVDELHLHRHRDDFVLEEAVRLRSSHTPLGLEGVFVLAIAGHT